MDFFQRQAIAFTNELRQSCGALIGIVQGVLADGTLNDAEIRFLRDWLASNESITTCWPGDVLALKVNEALADGHITEAERLHLVSVLQQLTGGTGADPGQASHITRLALDDVTTITIAGATFCLTGEFTYGPRQLCERLLTERGATVSASVGKKLTYLVVGGLGSAEWKHGSFGTKVEKAMQLKAAGAPILVIHEDAVMRALFESGRHAA